MKVIAKLESSEDVIFSKDCDGDGKVGDAVCEAMNEAVAAAHEVGGPCVVEAEWECGDTYRWRISVETLPGKSG